MNVEIGTEATLFPEKEYISGIFLAVRCTHSFKASYLTRSIKGIVPPDEIALGVVPLDSHWLIQGLNIVYFTSDLFFIGDKISMPFYAKKIVKYIL